MVWYCFLMLVVTHYGVIRLACGWLQQRGSCQSQCSMLPHPLQPSRLHPALMFILGFPRNATPSFPCDHIFVLHTLPLCSLALPCKLHIFPLDADWVIAQWPSHIQKKSPPPSGKGERRAEIKVYGEGLASLDKKPGQW